jgi:hypothetical protein
MQESDAGEAETKRTKINKALEISGRLGRVAGAANGLTTGPSYFGSKVRVQVVG